MLILLVFKSLQHTQKQPVNPNFQKNIIKKRTQQFKMYVRSTLKDLEPISFWVGPPQSLCLKISSVQLLSHVRLFATPSIATRQASLSITNSRSSLRLMSIESVMPTSHLIICHPLFFLPQSFPASESFPMSQFFASGGQTIGVSA